MLNKVFNSTFDFFSHAIPGILISLSLFTLQDDINSMSDLFAFTKKMNPSIGILLLFSGYILGFAIHPLGRMLYKSLGFWLWPKKIENNIDIPIYDKYVLIRKLSPANFKYVETWNMYSAMAHNLAIAFVVVLGVAIHKSFLPNTDTTFWAIIIVISILFFFIFLHRAVVFYFWAAHDLNATIKQFDMLNQNNNK